MLVAVMQVLGRHPQGGGVAGAVGFFGTLFLINFAMGRYGIVQEFQFGMNLLKLLGVRGQHLRRPARDGGAARVLPRVDVHRAVAVRP